MIELGKKIKELRLSKGYTQKQLSEELKLTSDSTISQWERGVNSPYGKDLVKLTKLFNVTSDYLLGLDVDDDKIDEYTYFPTAISAGLPLEVDGITEASQISISKEALGRFANDKDLYFVRANGDSMDKLFKDGSLLGIKPVTLDNLKNGDIVVYSCDGDYSVKHYHRYGDTLVFTPNSTNTDHKEHQYNIEDEVKLHGKVVISINVHD